MNRKEEMNEEELREEQERKEKFINRLTQLRMDKNASSRDMSLSLGQSPAYINNIENGVNLPSMNTFFYICEFLGVTPAEFFSYDIPNPRKSKDVTALISRLSTSQLDLIEALLQELLIK